MKETTAQLALPTADDLAMYDSTFAAHNSGGYIDGNAARVVFLRSQLPAEVLSSIWRLSDMDTDAQLSHSEFRVAMHLVMQNFRHGVAVPAVLPPAVTPPASCRRAGCCRRMRQRPWTRW